MKFYDRKQELEILEKCYKSIDNESCMIVITGRRRIGKTVLSLKFTETKPHLYLFVSKKTEGLLCQEYVKQIKEFFNEPVFGEITNFKDLFALLLELSKRKPFVLILDEVQEFLNINPSIFSDLQQLWDLNKGKSHLQLIFLGSVYSLMHKIFQDSQEPLFGRADWIFHLKPFSVKTLYQILSEHNHSDLTTLFAFYLITGGTPKYIDVLLSNGVFAANEMFDFILSDNSPFLDEGKNLLIEEFGKEYGVYFSILELISIGKTGRSELESLLEKNVGGYLERLEKDYGIIKRYKPINAKPNSRLQKFHIKDNFLRFWFRFIYRHRTAVETGNFSYLRKVLSQNLPTYSGYVMEQFFYDLFAEAHRYNKIGSYWERGHQNEIDLIGINDLEKQMTIAEVKRNKDKINLEQLKMKAQNLLKSYPGYSVEWKGLSLDDAGEYLY